LQVALQSEINGPANFVACDTVSKEGTQTPEKEASKSLSAIISNNKNITNESKSKSNEKIEPINEEQKLDSQENPPALKQQMIDHFNPEMKVSLISISEPRDCMLGSYSSTIGNMEAGPKDLPS